MRAAPGSAVLSVCLVALMGCASPPPAAPALAGEETDEQRAQRLINYSVESGEPINTADGQKIICKQESVTNTRLKSKKICLSQDEWLARTNNAKDGVRDTLRAGEYVQPPQK